MSKKALHRKRRKNVFELTVLPWWANCCRRKTRRNISENIKIHPLFLRRKHCMACTHKLGNIKGTTFPQTNGQFYWFVKNEHCDLSIAILTKLRITFGRPNRVEKSRKTRLYIARNIYNFMIIMEREFFCWYLSWLISFWHVFLTASVLLQASYHDQTGKHLVWKCLISVTVVFRLWWLQTRLLFLDCEVFQKR